MSDWNIYISANTMAPVRNNQLTSTKIEGKNDNFIYLPIRMISFLYIFAIYVVFFNLFPTYFVCYKLEYKTMGRAT